MSISKKLLLATLSLFSSPFIQAAGPGTTNDFGGKRVLYIGIDGVRPDSLQAANTPNIDALAANGIITYNAFAGGVSGTPTQQATSSGPGWSTLLTGVWVDKHKVESNSFSPRDFTNYPHFFRRIKDLHPTSHLSSTIHWGPIDTTIVEDSKVGGVEFLSFRKNVSSDTAVANEAVSDIQNSNPDAIFLHFDDVDHAGHAHGYGSATPEYISSIEGVDTHIGTIITAVKARPQYAQEDWLIIVTTDHGGINTGHGGQSIDERQIFLLVSGGATPNGVVSTATPGQTACAPTVMRHLGVPVDSAWNWEEGSFGLPAPTFNAEAAGKHAILSWTIPPAGISNLTGFEILRDGASIANLPITAKNYTDSPSFPSGTQANFNYEIRFTGSTESPLTDNVTLGSAGVADVVSNLEMHLTFDSTTDDATANNHDATAFSGASYVAGVNGQAAVIGNGKYFSVPQTGGLLFGSTQDFTIGFWMKSNTTWNSDPSFISNKNWSSGANQGWIIAGASSNPQWQWNLKGADAGRADFDNGQTVSDGNWHHILISHDRDGNASFYQNGSLIGSVSIAGNGSTDTALPIGIGNDGTLSYGLNQEIHIDDLKIWRRALSPTDAAEEGKQNNPLFVQWKADHFTPAELSDPNTSGDTADPDGDGLENFAEFALGTDPRDPHHANPITITPNGNNFIISWPQRNNGNGDIGVDYKAEDVMYILQYTADLKTTWSSGASIIIEHSAPEFMAAGWHLAKATLVTPPATNINTGSFRLKLTQ